MAAPGASPIATEAVKAASVLDGVGMAVMAMADPRKTNPPISASSNTPIASSETKAALGTFGSSSNSTERQ